jgi:hypothetical protein
MNHEHVLPTSHSKRLSTLPLCLVYRALRSCLPRHRPTARVASFVTDNRTLPAACLMHLRPAKSRERCARPPHGAVPASLSRRPFALLYSKAEQLALEAGTNERHACEMICQPKRSISMLHACIYSPGPSRIVLRSIRSGGHV